MMRNCVGMQGRHLSSYLNSQVLLQSLCVHALSQSTQSGRAGSIEKGKQSLRTL